MLAIGDDLAALPGQATREPVFGLAGKWVPAELRSQAELTGATVVDRASVIITHLAEVVRQHASRLLGREDVRVLTDVVKRTHPVVVEELTPALLSLGEIQRVLQAPARRGVADPRPGPDLRGALAARRRAPRRSTALVEAARLALGPAHRVAVPRGQDAARCSPSTRMLEQQLLESVRPSEHGQTAVLDPETSQALMTELMQLTQEIENRNVRPVLVCAPQLRSALHRMVNPLVPRLAVLSYTELTGADQIRSEGVVGTDQRLAVNA